MQLSTLDTLASHMVGLLTLPTHPAQSTDLRSTLDASGARALDSFLDDTVRQVPALCTQVYFRSAASLLVLEPVVSSIRNRSWTLKEIGTQHNAYVDQLLDHLRQLSNKLNVCHLGGAPNLPCRPPESFQSICIRCREPDRRPTHSGIPVR